MLSEIYGWLTKIRLRRRTGHQALGRSSLKNLADPGVRCLLNHAKQLVAFDGHTEVWADRPSFANAFSHPYVQLRNVERKQDLLGACRAAYDHR